MAYADQKMSGNRVTALVIVALIHVVIGYALVSGLAYEGVKAVMKKVTTVDVKEEKPKEPPPPPPKQDTPPPPIVAPPPPVNVAITPPAIQTVVTPPPPAPAPPPVLAAPAAPPAPPPPAPKGPAVPAAPRGDPGSWVTPEDYPSGPLHEGAQGTTGFRVTIDTSGKVASCEITSSSGNDQLDKATCQYVTRRARFTPAKDTDNKPVAGSYASRVKWVVPKD